MSHFKCSQNLISLNLQFFFIAKKFESFIHFQLCHWRNFENASAQLRESLFVLILSFRFAYNRSNTVKFDFKTRDRRNKPNSLSLAFFFSFFMLSEFFSSVSGFFEGSSWISQAIFLNFSGRLLINSTSITGINWAQ